MVEIGWNRSRNYNNRLGNIEKQNYFWGLQKKERLGKLFEILNNENLFELQKHRRLLRYFIWNVIISYITSLFLHLLHL